MKIKLHFLFIIFFHLTVIAQNKLAFSYDTSGNQVLREKLCLNCPLNKEQVVEVVDSTSQLSKDAIKILQAPLSTENAFKIVAYPNPVSEVLQVEWIDDPLKVPIRMTLFSRENRKLAEFVITPNRYQQDIQFSHYPTGVYILSVFFENGERRTFQIIKN